MDSNGILVSLLHLNTLVTLKSKIKENSEGTERGLPSCSRSENTETIHGSDCGMMVDCFIMGNQIKQSTKISLNCFMWTSQ